MLNIRKWVIVTPELVTLNGRTLPVGPDTEKGILHTYYNQYMADSYPKFFKMDPLCKLGFISSEFLLKDEPGRFEPREDRAVVIFNVSGSFASDSNYQKTICRPDEYYPSPAIFVYTLANIVTGEIAIRNKYYGETSLYLTEDRNIEEMVRTVQEAFMDGRTESAICGFINCHEEEDFESFLCLVEKEDVCSPQIEWNTNTIKTILKSWKN